MQAQTFGDLRWITRVVGGSMSIYRSLLSVSLLTIVSTTIAFSQSFTGSISGIVTDASAAAVPNARVTAVELQTNVSSATVANALGLYAFPSLRPGQYRVDAEAAGFKKLVRTGLEVQVATGLRVDLKLEVGAVTESMTISGQAPLVQSDNAALGTVIANREIVDLPVNGRNPFTLVSLAAGVTTGGIYAGGVTEDFTSAANFMVNGGRAASSEMLVDGITNTVPIANPISLVAIFPSLDMLEEFKLQSSNYSAEYGRSGNGVLNMVLKSGTNKLHGTAYEFLRNSAMDANSFFANRNGTPLGSFKRNQFGFSLGGPIIRDKLFFFTNYEWQRIRSAANTLTTVPTTLERSGDFSRTQVLTGGQCVSTQIYNPFSTRQTTPGVYIRDAFPGNKIPSSMIDKVGSNLVSYLPNPSNGGLACTGTSNFFASASNRTDVDQWDGKFDWIPDSKDRATVGLSYRDSESIAPNFYGNISQSGALSGLRGDGMPAKGGRVEFARTQSPTLLLGIKFGVTRGQRSTPANAPPGFSITTLGFPASLAAQAVQPQTFPRVSYAGYAAQGPSLTQFISQEGTAYSWEAYAAKVTGRHTIKAGWQYRVQQSAEISGISASGNFTFGQNFTQGPNPFTAGAALGNGIASALLGTGTGAMDIWPAVLTSDWYTALYFQDDIKVTPKLTLNVGLRYDLGSGRAERFNQLSSFDFNAINPVGAKVGLPNLKGGLQFVGVNGNGSNQSELDTNNVAPRVGLAYALNPKTAIRAGYGLFYTEFPGSAAGVVSGISGFQVSTPWTSSLDGVTPLNLISNPFPSGLAFPTGSKAGLATNVGLGIDAVDRGNKTSYVQSWDFSLQREFPGQIAVEAAYVGSKGTKLGDGSGGAGLAIDQLNPIYLSLGTRLSQQVPNPFFGLVSVGPLSQPTVAYGQLLRPYPQFTGVTDLRPSLASSNYHGLNLTVQKRLTHGVMIVFTYSFSKLIDDASAVVGFLGPTGNHQDVYNRSADRSTDPMDVSQRANFNYIWELPFGRGRQFGSNMSKVLDAIVGGWQFNGITVFSKGYPLAFTTANTSGLFNATERPNSTGVSATVAGGRSKDQMMAQYFTTNVFSIPASFTLGNVGRTSELRSPGIANYDLSMFKQFRIRERVTAEFRGEFFNAFNYVQLAGPNTSVGSSTFGQISGQANTPRQGQVALKLRF